MELTEKILNGFKISKPQRKFLLTLFTTILVARGKINFRNLSRHSDLCEHTYSRQFTKSFDFVRFNRRVIDEAFGAQSERILAFDPTFIPKAGKHTFGRDSFWNGCANRSQRGLELSALAVVDLELNQALTLSAEQTLSREAFAEASTITASPPEEEAEQTRMQQYLAHLQAVRSHLSACERYLTVDGSFANADFIDGVTDLALNVIGKLRTDANMRYLYEGPKRPGRGRKKTYDGKVDWQDLNRFHYVGRDEGLTLYTQVLNHIKFQRTLRVVVLVKHIPGKSPRYVLLFSTDVNLDPWKIYQYYKARFQIEFLFRDAKQFTGLCDSQARDHKRLDFHFNASLTTLNLAKTELIQNRDQDQPLVCSLATVKALYFNQNFLDRIIRIFGLNPNFIKNQPEYQALREYGKIAA